MLKMLLASVAVMLLAGCSGLSVHERIATADQLATSAGWIKQRVQTSEFVLQSYHSAFQPSQRLTVYIEGDGLAWISRTRPSLNPTPVDPLALKLAIKDRGNVVYLARPCQYIESSGCITSLWTSARFSPQVVSAMNRAITQLKAQSRSSELVLVGYSGGGNIAALIAARRNDVARLVTVAGNLDHRRWTRLMKVSPLTQSLDAADYWQQLVSVPQLHLVGDKDQSVPPAIARAYQAKFPQDHQPQVRVIPGFDHHCCWLERWPQLMEP